MSYLPSGIEIEERLDGECADLLLSTCKIEVNAGIDTDCYAKKYSACMKAACQEGPIFEMLFGKDGYRECAKDCNSVTRKLCMKKKEVINETCRGLLNIDECLYYERIDTKDFLTLNYLLLLSMYVFTLAFIYFSASFKNRFGFMWRKVLYIPVLTCFNVHWSKLQIISKKKVSVLIADIDVSDIDRDLRTDDEQRMDLKHKGPFLATAHVTYYETSYVSKLRSSKRPRKMRVLKAVFDEHDLTFSYGMFCQLIKHANVHKGLSPDTVMAKMDQHMAYLCTWNHDAYDIAHAVKQNTVLVAAMYYKYLNDSRKQDQIFRQVLNL
jgi:hypothetical protein